MGVGSSAAHPIRDAGGSIRPPPVPIYAAARESVVI